MLCSLKNVCALVSLAFVSVLLSQSYGFVCFVGFVGVLSPLSFDFVGFVGFCKWFVFSRL